MANQSPVPVLLLPPPVVLVLAPTFCSSNVATAISSLVILHTRSSIVTPTVLLPLPPIPPLSGLVVSKLFISGGAISSGLLATLPIRLAKPVSFCAANRLLSWIHFVTGGVTPRIDWLRGDDGAVGTREGVTVPDGNDSRDGVMVPGGNDIPPPLVGVGRMLLFTLPGSEIATSTPPRV